MAEGFRRLGRVLGRQTIVRPVLIAVLGLAFAWIVAGHVAKATGYTGANAVALIAGRSPGARSEGILAQTKQPKNRVASNSRNRGAPQPHQRVLSEVRNHGPALAGGLPVIDLGDPATSLPILPRAMSLANAIPAQASPVFSAPDTALPAILLPPGTVGTTPTGPTTPVNPAAPVPEPDTWAMMIIGVGMVGMVSRRRKPRSLVHSAG